MSFTDSSLAVQATYTYIHNRQVYDALSAQLSTHPAWAFVESVDYVNGTTTMTTYVWKCLATASGLAKDYYVGFRTSITSGVYSVISGLQVFLFEDYNSTTHVASKYATRVNSGSITLNSDATSAGTWTLTAAPPTSDPIPSQVVIGPVSINATGSTSFRMLTTVSATTIVVFAFAGAAYLQQLYVGGFDSLIGATLDPLPLILGMSSSYGSGSSTGTNQTSGYFSATRHPGLGSTAGTNLFNFSPGLSHNDGANGGFFGKGTLLTTGSATASGTLGNTGDTSAGLWLGVPASRVMLWTAGGGTASTRGGLRGLLKHVITAPLATNAFGDTFTVDGAAYAAMGQTNSQYGLLDTTA